MIKIGKLLIEAAGKLALGWHATDVDPYSDNPLFEHIHTLASIVRDRAIMQGLDYHIATTTAYLRYTLSLAEDREEYVGRYQVMMDMFLVTIMDALDALTMDTKESFDEYITRVRANPIATLIKQVELELELKEDKVSDVNRELFEEALKTLS